MGAWHVLLYFFTCDAFGVCITCKTRNISLSRQNAGKPYLKHWQDKVLVHEFFGCASNLVMRSLCSKSQFHTARDSFLRCVMLILGGYDCVLPIEMWLYCSQQWFYCDPPLICLEHSGGNAPISVEQTLHRTFDAGDCKRSCT